MKAFVLAAGEGTRLRPFTSDKPKCMVEIEGISLLDRQLDVLSKGNISQIIIIGGYRADQLPTQGVKVVKNPQYAVTNMLWSLMSAEKELEGDLIVSYGDIVYSVEILNDLLRSKGDITVAVDFDWYEYWKLRNDDPLSDAETLRMSGDKIIEIGKKPRALVDIEAQYIGLIRFTRGGISQFKRIFNELKLRHEPIQGKSLEKAYMTDMLQELIDRNVVVNALPIKGGWIEVDTISDLHLPITSQRVREIQDGLKR